MSIILHIDMDAFFAAIEERDNPQFQGKPIVVGADPKAGFGRGVVSTANYEARKYGIKSAMPISWAYRANPRAIFLPVDMKRYKKASKKVMEILRKYAGRMEQVSVDEAYLEIGLRTKDLGQSGSKIRKIAQAIKKEIWGQERLTCSIGIGPNKLIAKIASGDKKPDGLTVVQPNEVQEFLDLKPARILPGIGPKTFSRLQKKWEIKTVKDLRQISKEELVKEFGKNGIWLWKAARGIDEREIQEEHEIKSIGRQTTFLEDTNDPRQITQTIFDLLEETFNELKEEGLIGKTLTIIIRYQGFETHSSQETIAGAFDLNQARRLALKLLLPYLNKKRRVRLVGVRISGFNTN